MPRAQSGSQQGPSKRGGPGGLAKQRQRPGQDRGPGPEGRQSRNKEESGEPRTYGRGRPRGWQCQPGGQTQAPSPEGRGLCRLRAALCTPSVLTATGQSLGAPCHACCHGLTYSSGCRGVSFGVCALALPGFAATGGNAAKSKEGAPSELLLPGSVASFLSSRQAAWGSGAPGETNVPGLGKTLPSGPLLPDADSGFLEGASWGGEKSPTLSLP